MWLATLHHSKWKTKKLQDTTRINLKFQTNENDEPTNRSISKNIMICPVCRNNNQNCKLVLKQINFSTAVYLCEDETCTYPVGYEWMFVQRNLENIYTWKDQLPIQNETTEISEQNDIDNWLNEIFDKEAAVTATPASDNSHKDNNIFDLTEIETWLNSTPQVNDTEKSEEHEPSWCANSSNLSTITSAANINLKLNIPNSDCVIERKNNSVDVTNVETNNINSGINLPVEKSKSNQNTKLNRISYISYIIKPGHSV